MIPKTLPSTMNDDDLDELRRLGGALGPVDELCSRLIDDTIDQNDVESLLLRILADRDLRRELLLHLRIHERLKEIATEDGGILEEE